MEEKNDIKKVNKRELISRKENKLYNNIIKILGKKPNDKKVVIMVTIACILLIAIIGILIFTKIRNDNNSGEYTVKVNIEFPGNWIFNKYDVKFSIGNRKTTLYHGENKDIELRLDSGDYKISFVNMDDSSIRYDEIINIDSNMELSYRIHCYFNRIEVETLYIDRDKLLDDNQIKIDFDSSKFYGKNYKDVVSILSELGFTNIEEKPIYDIFFDITPAGEIGTVKIDDRVDYKRGDVFNKDVKIIVNYHMKDDDDPSKAKAPYYRYSYSNINYQEVEKAFQDVGFTNIILETVKTSSINNSENVYSITIDGQTPEKDELYKKDAKVVIKYYNYEEGSNSGSSEEDYGDGKHQTIAKRSFENMGKSLYPYGIKFHWIAGLIDFSYKGNGIWHIEVEVTITNQYNAKRDAIASGNVNFITEKVEDFNVKNK